MGLTRHHRPIGSLLAVALGLGASFLPAAAQSGSEAVVCVGSETRTLQTNPIRRVYTEDIEIVYRIGADIGQRDQVERDLSSELSSYPEVWCAWSDTGDDHAVTISYTADRPGCYLWNPNPRENVTVTWSGGCSNGLAQGKWTGKLVSERRTHSD